MDSFTNSKDKADVSDDSTLTDESCCLQPSSSIRKRKSSMDSSIESKLSDVIEWTAKKAAVDTSHNDTVDSYWIEKNTSESCNITTITFDTEYSQSSSDNEDEDDDDDDETEDEELEQVFVLMKAISKLQECIKSYKSERDNLQSEFCAMKHKNVFGDCPVKNVAVTLQATTSDDDCKFSDDKFILFQDTREQSTLYKLLISAGHIDIDGNSADITNTKHR